jgi:hypothetical protein
MDEPGDPRAVASGRRALAPLGYPALIIPIGEVTT